MGKFLDGVVNMALAGASDDSADDSVDFNQGGSGLSFGGAGAVVGMGGGTGLALGGSGTEAAGMGGGTGLTSGGIGAGEAEDDAVGVEGVTSSGPAMTRYAKMIGGMLSSAGRAGGAPRASNESEQYISEFNRLAKESKQDEELKADQRMEESIRMMAEQGGQS